MLPSHSEIMAGAIHKEANILLYHGIELGPPRWELATTTTMLPAIPKL